MRYNTEVPQKSKGVKFDTVKEEPIEPKPTLQMEEIRVIP